MIAGRSSFYQLGFVARDLDMATAALGRRFGVSRFRRKRAASWLETAHAWSSGVMIEVMQIGEGAPAIYAGYTPADAGAIRLHHHGYRVSEIGAWQDIEHHIARARLTVPISGKEMSGDLWYMYVDTRAELGIYTEFVMLKGAASALYDDVPRNEN